jgi:hypothetical protein
MVLRIHFEDLSAVEPGNLRPPARERTFIGVSNQPLCLKAVGPDCCQIVATRATWPKPNPAGTAPEKSNAAALQPGTEGQTPTTQNILPKPGSGPYNRFTVARREHLAVKKRAVALAIDERGRSGHRNIYSWGMSIPDEARSGTGDAIASPAKVFPGAPEWKRRRLTGPQLPFFQEQFYLLMFFQGWPGQAA